MGSTMIAQGDLFGLWGNSAPTTTVVAQTTAVPTVLTPLGNFRLEGDRDLSRGWRQRGQDNVDALRLVGEIEARGTPATTDEQLALSKFTGFGASDLANGMFRTPAGTYRKGWETLATELEQTVDSAAMDGLMKATQYAHYTPEAIARAMWEAVTTLGFKGGDVVEPGCGSGMFIATAPSRIAAASRFVGIDDDPSSVRLCRLLYPAAQFVNEDYCASTTLRACDLAIGNPPYSDRKVVNSTPIGRLGLSLHDHFIARAMSGLRPGGLAAFLTSRFTMDKSDETMRRAIAVDHDLVAAVRLPNGCMKQAGTEVLADVLVFRKRLPGEAPTDANWMDTVEAIPASGIDPAVYINRWFIDRPRAVLGRQGLISSQFGPVYGCTPEPGSDLGRLLSAQLTAAIGTYTGGSRTVRTGTTGATSVPLFQTAIHSTAPVQTAKPIDVRLLQNGPGGRHLREGSYVMRGGTLMQVNAGIATPVTMRSRSATSGMPSTHAKLIAMLLPVRDALREVIDDQLADLPWAGAQARLSAAYSAFLIGSGKPINHTVHGETIDPKTGAVRDWTRQPTIAAFRSDPDCWLVASIEDYDPTANAATRGRVFAGRILGPCTDSEITSAVDALPITLRDKGRVDMRYLAALAGMTEDAAAEALGDRVFLDPADHCWTAADAYLSGTVKKRLELATTAATGDPRFARNVVALEAVQPRPLAPSEITVGLGAPWISPTVISDFTLEVFGQRLPISHVPVIGLWSVDDKRANNTLAFNTTWGTKRLSAAELLDHALNSRTPTVHDKVYDAYGNSQLVVNHVDTEAARAKQQNIEREFSRWIWVDAERSVTLVKRYNDDFNNIVPRRFDGSHLTLDDSNLAIRFYEKQKRAIWRIIASGTTYLAHFMGAGKTFTLIAAVMEQRRLGLVRKPMLVVPNHVLEQIATEFMQLYPTAHILVANEEDMARKNRLRFMARATTQDWDCVIVTHSAFGFIPVSREFESRMLIEQRASYIEALETGDVDNIITRKKLERAKEKISQRIQALSTVKDDLVTFGDMGIDQIIVDEAHEFRKLSFATNRKNIKGIDPEGSQRAWELLVKARYVEQVNPGRGLILSSGSPISNTLAELFTILRLMDPKALKDRSVHTFDAWASTFGQMKTELEMQPNGKYKRVSRFCEFVNLPELTAMYRQFADIVLEEELKEYLTLPRLRTGGRQIVACEPTKGFLEGQAKLGVRIEALAKRTGRPRPGDDIILSVIGDGRLLALDPRTLNPDVPNDPGTKINELIRRAHAIWLRDQDRQYLDPATGTPMPIRGCSQMIFSDIAIAGSDRRGGFSAYEWIRSELIRLGVPPQKIAFMQQFTKASSRRGAFKALVTGSIQFLLGSTPTMGTGANAQARLAAMHHLDQPYLVSAVSQRECRMVRQGNQNPEVDLIAYVTSGSMDATMWQFLKRKAAFVNAIMKGDPTVRRMDEEDGQVASFAYARAMASGDERLMKKAGLEADIGRLNRLRQAHIDGQFANKSRLHGLRSRRVHLKSAIAGKERDIDRMIDTSGGQFTMTVGRTEHHRRVDASLNLAESLHEAEMHRSVGDWTLGSIGGFEVRAFGAKGAGHGGEPWYHLTTVIRCDNEDVEVELNSTPGSTGGAVRLENAINRFPDVLAGRQRDLLVVESSILDYEGSQETPFEFEEELDRIEAEDQALDIELAGPSPTLEQRVEAETNNDKDTSEETTDGATGNATADPDDGDISPEHDSETDDAEYDPDADTTPPPVDVTNTKTLGWTPISVNAALAA